MRASTSGPAAVRWCSSIARGYRLESAASELDGDVDERANVVVVGAEVDEARPQADLAVDRGRRDPDARVLLEGADEQRVGGVQVGRRRRGAGTGRSRAAAGRRAARAGRARARARRAAAPAAGSPRPLTRNASAPWARNASQSLSARNGREYSSVMSTMCPVRSCGMYASSCANAWIRSSRLRTRSTPHAFGRYSHLCASSVTESARSRPAKRWPADGVVAAGSP